VSTSIPLRRGCNHSYTPTTLSFAELIGELTTVMGVQPGEMTRFIARCTNLLRGHPGANGWAPLLNKGSGRGVAATYTRGDLLHFYVAMHLNLAGVSPAVAVPVTLRALPGFAEAQIQRQDYYRNTEPRPISLRLSLPSALGNLATSVRLMIPEQMVMDAIGISWRDSDSDSDPKGVAQ